MSEEQDTTPVPGKPWNVDSFHASYDAADSRRKELIAEWASIPMEGMQTKVRYHSHKDSYSVRVRLDPSLQPEKPKKKAKKNIKNQK